MRSYKWSVRHCLARCARCAAFMAMERRRTRLKAHQATPGRYLCRNPFHEDWESSSSSPRDRTTRQCIVEILSDVSASPVPSICRSCRNIADSRPEILSHRLYIPPRELAANRSPAWKQTETYTFRNRDLLICQDYCYVPSS